MKKVRAQNISRNQNGFTILEILTSAVIGLTLISALGSLLMSGANFSVQVGVTSAADNLRYQLKGVLASPRNLKTTLRLDPIMKSCFSKGSETSSCPAQTELGVTLYDLDGHSISGPPEKPARYRVNGDRCTSPPPQDSPVEDPCRIEVSTTVRAQGRPAGDTLMRFPASETDYHEFIEVRYQIVIHDSKTQKTKPRGGTFTYDTQDLEDL